MIRDTKYIIKRIIIGVAIALILNFLTACNVKAYVTIEGANGIRINPNNYNITNINSNWALTSGSYSNYNDPWLTSIGQFWYAGGVSGTYFNVVADYYFGVKQEPYSDALLNNYLGGANNTLLSSNLRCAIGDYRTGYDSTYIPEVSNFNVTYSVNHLSSGSQYLYHVTFNYKQQIRSINKNNTNMSCWFERVPSNGLFAQTIWVTSNDTLRYYYYNQNFQYSVSDDPNTSALNTITSQNDTIINQNNITNNHLNDISNDLNDDNINGASSTASSFFDNFTSDTHGLTGIITAPLTMIQSITSSSCSPLTLPLPFVNENLTLPCMSSIYSQYFGSFFQMYQIITFGIISYWVCVKIFALVKSFKDPNDDRIEVLDL